MNNWYGRDQSKVKLFVLFKPRYVQNMIHLPGLELGDTWQCIYQRIHIKIRLLEPKLEYQQVF